MAGIFFNPDKLSPYSVADKAKGFRTDFSQNYEAAKNDFFARLRSDSQVSAFTELFSQNDQLIADLGGEINPNPLFLNHSDTIRVPEVEDMVKSMNDDLMERNDVYDFNDFINSYDAHMDWYFKEVDRLKASGSEDCRTSSTTSSTSRGLSRPSVVRLAEIRTSRWLRSSCTVRQQKIWLSSMQE